MKIKKKQKAVQSRHIIFAITFIYNLVIGIYPKDFLVLSPTLITFYLLSALPTVFFFLKIQSTPMRAIVLVVLFFVLGMSMASALYCRRLLPMLTFIIAAIEMVYFDNY